MATLNFYLDKPDRKSQCPIFLVYQSKGRKFKYFTKEKIESKAWNNDSQKVKRNYSGADEINDNLDALSEKIKKIERDARLQSIDPTVSYVKEQFLDKVGNERNDKSFYPIYDKYFEDSKSVKKKDSLRTQRATVNLLKEFEVKKRYEISFDSITHEFYEKFLRFLIRDKNQLNNTVGKHIKHLKTFMNYALKKGYTKNDDFKDFKVLKEEVDLIYLNEDELMRLYELKLDNQRLVNVRDNFCLACFTGLRFSDISKLRREHILDDYIILKTEKTKDNLRIPLNVYAKGILAKYVGKDQVLPPSITNQKTNLYLKELGKLAEINDTIEITQYSGSEKIVKVEPKYKLLTTHAARRTFVTLALEKGFRPEVVMEMTGHKKYETFKKYIKITDKVKKAEMDRLWKKAI